jgi:hypothetical protein
MSAYLIACSPPIAAKIIHMGKPLRAQHARKRTGEPVVVLLLTEKHLILAESLGLPLTILEER